MNWGREVLTILSVVGIWVVIQIIQRKAGVPT
jgi:hypothetical protein